MKLNVVLIMKLNVVLIR